MMLSPHVVTIWQTPSQSCMEVGHLDERYVRLCSTETGTKHMSTMSCRAHCHHAHLDNNYVNAQQSNFGTQKLRLIFLKIPAGWGIVNNVYAYNCHLI